jgi:hypothetical protein
MWRFGQAYSNNSSTRQNDADQNQRHVHQTAIFPASPTAPEVFKMGSSALLGLDHASSGTSIRPIASSIKLNNTIQCCPANAECHAIMMRNHPAASVRPIPSSAAIAKLLLFVW